MKFRENLPHACPPNHAKNDNFGPAYRLADSAKPVLTDFDSAAAKNEPMHPKADACRWASCSFFTSIDILKKKQKTYPKLKKMGFFIEMTITSDAGRYVAENGHIDLWMYRDFNPLNKITKVASIT